MNTSVDVLAAMDRLAFASCDPEAGAEFADIEAHVARAAVAELIEAGEEFATCDSLDAQKRFKAALARVKGA